MSCVIGCCVALIATVVMVVFISGKMFRFSRKNHVCKEHDYNTETFELLKRIASDTGCTLNCFKDGKIYQKPTICSFMFEKNFKNNWLFGIEYEYVENCVRSNDIDKCVEFIEENIEKYKKTL